MKTIPFETIKAAKENNTEAAQSIAQFFEGYITKRSLRFYKDEDRNEAQYIDDDLHYLGEIALCAAIFRFQFKDPPADFAP